MTLNVPSFKTVEKVETLCHCLNCAKKLIQATASVLVQCDKCGHSMLMAKCKKSKCARVLVEIGDSTLHLVAFESTLQAIVPGDFGSFTENQLLEFLLLCKDFKLTYDPDSLFINDIVLSA